MFFKIGVLTTLSKVTPALHNLHKNPIPTEGKFQKFTNTPGINFNLVHVKCVKWCYCQK